MARRGAPGDPCGVRGSLTHEGPAFDAALVGLGLSGLRGAARLRPRSDAGAGHPRARDLGRRARPARLQAVGEDGDPRRTRDRRPRDRQRRLRGDARLSGRMARHLPARAGHQRQPHRLGAGSGRRAGARARRGRDRARRHRPAAQGTDRAAGRAARPGRVGRGGLSARRRADPRDRPRGARAPDAGTAAPLAHAAQSGQLAGGGQRDEHPRRRSVERGGHPVRVGAGSRHRARQPSRDPRASGGGPAADRPGPGADGAPDPDASGSGIRARPQGGLAARLAGPDRGAGRGRGGREPRDHALGDGRAAHDAGRRGAARDQLHPLCGWLAGRPGLPQERPADLAAEPLRGPSARRPVPHRDVRRRDGARRAAHRGAAARAGGRGRNLGHGLPVHRGGGAPAVPHRSADARQRAQRSGRRRTFELPQQRDRPSGPRRHRDRRDRAAAGAAGLHRRGDGAGLSGGPDPRADRRALRLADAGGRSLRPRHAERGRRARRASAGADRLPARARSGAAAGARLGRAGGGPHRDLGPLPRGLSGGLHPDLAHELPSARHRLLDRLRHHAPAARRAEKPDPAQDPARSGRAQCRRVGRGLSRDHPRGPRRGQFGGPRPVEPRHRRRGPLGRHRFRPAEHRRQLRLGHHPADRAPGLRGRLDRGWAACRAR